MTIKDADVFTLDKLQYSEERKGLFALYIYGEDGMHSGRQYFREKPEFVDEEITIGEAYAKTASAMKLGVEVRVCDGGDMLVFHVMGEKILFGDQFWKEIGVGNTISG